MKEFVAIAEKCICELSSLLRATSVGFTVLYYLSRYVFLGNYDDRMIELIKSLSNRSPIYVKVFQSLAGSSGLLSPTVQEFLTIFSDNVPFNDDDERYDYLRRHLSYVSELKPEMTVTNLSHRPIHSGTVSLVYDGMINGEPIVVKCVRKDVYAKMVSALEEAEYVVGALSFIPVIKCLNLSSVLAENKQSLLEQTNMRHELSNLTQLREKLHCRDYIVTPKPYPIFTEGNDEILVMEKLTGRRVDEINEDEKEDYGMLLARQAIDAILTDGIYHADLHRGNVLFMDVFVPNNTDESEHSIDDGCSATNESLNTETITTDGNRVKKIGILDFGIMGHLSESEQLTLSSFYLSLGMGNYDDVVNSIIGTLTNNEVLEKMEREKYDSIVEELTSLTRNACTSQEGFGPCHMQQINRIFTKNGLQLAPIFCRIEMALAMNASVSKRLETKNKNFMNYLQIVIQSKMDMSIYDV